ncbi:MAG: IS110 family transposase [Acidimicrobiales bacterium]
MNTIAHHDVVVIGSVDTHKDVHVAAVKALDNLGRLLGTESFPTTRPGYRRLFAWLQSHGDLDVVGVEGCGSWGAGLARYLAARGVRVVEVNRPNRQERRRRGKSDVLDAEAAARAALAGQATVTPKAGTGPVEALRQRVARSGAIKARTAAANQIHSLCDTAPDAIRAQLTRLTMPKKIARAERWRPGPSMTPENAAKRAIDDEARALQHHTKAILDELAPSLLAVHGVGYDTAAQLLITAGDNPHRLRHERSFAALCGATPVPDSSGRTSGRLRLDRGGDRHANSALAHRDRPQGHPPGNEDLRRTPHPRRHAHHRNHPRPQALRRPRTSSPHILATADHHLTVPQPATTAA